MWKSKPQEEDRVEKGTCERYSPKSSLLGPFSIAYADTQAMPHIKGRQSAGDEITH